MYGKVVTADRSVAIGIESVLTEEELAALSEKMRQSEQTGKSIGLGNIFRRVSMLYPDTGKMQVFSRAGHGTVIRFEIPQGEEEERA